jgi:hypothetical protein
MTKAKAAAPETSASESEASESEGHGEDAPHEDQPFEAVASLDKVDIPMELDGEPLTVAEIAAVDLAVNEFAKKVQTLAAEADAVFTSEFGIQCTDTERKSASRIMDIVSDSFIYILLNYCPFHYSPPSSLQK